MEPRFSKALYSVENHLGLAEKQVRNLASLSDRSHVVPYKPEPELLLEGEPEPKFVIVHQQQMDLFIEQLRSNIAVARRVLQDYAAAHGETATYRADLDAKDEQNR